MNHSSIQKLLSQRLLKTNGLQIREKGEAPFWYTSNLPGPYYINTQNIAGANASEEMLSNITSILTSTTNWQDKSDNIWNLIKKQLKEDKEYKQAIQMMIQYCKDHLQKEIQLISGGERRDWFFSIPFAILLDIPHLYLTKSGDAWYRLNSGMLVQKNLDQTEVLHVADIINHASSYKQNWLPILRKYEAAIAYTFSVASRNQSGINTLKNENLSVICPLHFQPSFFKEMYKLKLISKEAYESVCEYTESPKEWTYQLLKNQGDVLLYSVKSESATIRERIGHFVIEDPYQLKEDFKDLFQKISLITQDNNHK